MVARRCEALLLMRSSSDLMAVIMGRVQPFSLSGLFMVSVVTPFTVFTSSTSESAEPTFADI